nr:mediator of RNA polymerase II transcription subunit 15-like [Aedes albopictus]
MAEDNSWKTPSFRQSVVDKINEAIQQSGMTSSKNGLEMENHVFQKADNKDEYLGYVARLILHVREMSFNMAEDNSWKTPSFRQSVVNKINEAIQQSGMTSSKNGLEMENHVFQKAGNKDEYLGYVARLILHVREMNTKNKNQQNPTEGAQDGGYPNQQGDC